MSAAYPDSKVHGAKMGPIRGRQDPGGPHVGPMNFAIWVEYHDKNHMKLVRTNWYTQLSSINQKYK